MQNNKDLHITGIIGDTKNGKGKLVYLDTDTFNELSETFAAKKFNKENKGVAGVKRMVAPLQFNTGPDSEGTGTYVFPYNNATLYVQFEETDENQVDTNGQVVTDADGIAYKKTIRNHILIPKEAEEILKPVTVLI